MQFQPLENASPLEAVKRGRSWTTTRAAIDRYRQSLGHS
jgi:hypothetical protein